MSTRTLSVSYRSPRHWRMSRCSVPWPPAGEAQGLSGRAAVPLRELVPAGIARRHALGAVVRALAYQASPTELLFGSNRVYAAIHQFGGRPDMLPVLAAIPAGTPGPDRGRSGQYSRSYGALNEL
ncbi:MAG: hypothetical protein GYB38_12250 [Gammaproteobacteria bacterium]|nr:hypothetical protein [Gammaproteobacteria bacterium]